MIPVVSLKQPSGICLSEKRDGAGEMEPLSNSQSAFYKTNLVVSANYYWVTGYTDLF
jgi:hypothetical protein